MQKMILRVFLHCLFMYNDRSFEYGKAIEIKDDLCLDFLL